MTAIQPSERGAALEALDAFVAWEKAEPGSGWTHDFDLSPTRPG